jgi:hypothetical protein
LGHFFDKILKGLWQFFIYTICPYLNKMYYTLLKSAWKSWNVTKNKKFILIFHKKVTVWGGIISSQNTIQRLLI